MIIYEGDSLIDGSPIVVIGTWPTRNTKTGAMVQFWVLRRDIHPNEAIRKGQDVAICGECRMRGPNGDSSERSCYVNPMALGAIWKKYKAGGYQRANVWPSRPGVSADLYAPLQWPQWAPYRLTAYGDPGAVPLKVWQALLRTQPAGVMRPERFKSGWTGYTQLWREERIQEYRGLFHASVFTTEDAIYAVQLGWRYFFADAIVGPTVLKATECRHASSDGRIQCDRCQACSGIDGHFSGNVRAAAHGIGLRFFAGNVEDGSADEG